MASAVASITPFQDRSRVGSSKSGPARTRSVLRLLGVDVIGWLQSLWKQIRDVPLGYLLPGSPLHCQDIMVNSTYWKGVDEVATFEELCGLHGGMGGTQSRPFILCPSDWTPPSQQIVGAENVHLQFVRWLVDLGHTAYADLPDDPHRLVRTPTAGPSVRVA